jgi:hypothetical protein
MCWYKPGPDLSEPWARHVIGGGLVGHPHDQVVADVDGRIEIVCAEHDPFRPYRSRCRLYVYKRADSSGHAWTRHVADDRFEHHVGTRLISLASGRTGIISHGWEEPLYVHLWEPCRSSGTSRRRPVQAPRLAFRFHRPSAAFSGR